MTNEPTPTDRPSTNIHEMPAPLPVPAATVETAPNKPATAPTWPWKVDGVLLVLLLVLSFFLASFTASNSDLWTHLAIGKRISEGTFAFGVDPFSWATEATATKPAVFWVHHSWLFSLVLFQLYQAAGGMGLVIAKAALFTASIAILCRIGWTETNRWFVIICLVVGVLSASVMLELSPLIVSLLFLSITLFVLHRAGIFAQAGAAIAPNGQRWLWCLPPLFALWANLDHWFILGPLLVALCWLASGLAKWFPNGSPVTGKTLGLLLGVSLLACLVNPYHVKVFQLPPELAYLVLGVTDPFGVPLPDSLIAGGRSLKELARGNVQFNWTLSVLSRNYWHSSSISFTVAEAAFFPLIILGLLTFTLAALVRPQPNAPSLHVGRFILWLVFAVMALALHRLVPFFAIVAAPLTAMTLGEYLSWQQDTRAVALSRRDRGLNFARMLSVPFMLLLLAWAWPGGLHGGSQYHSGRRVAWEIRPNGSLKRAAETLQGLHEKGEGQVVFNGSLDMGNCLPWFAPDVKFFMDTRFSLYPGQAGTYYKVKEGLADPGKESDWQTVFEERKVKHIVVFEATRDPSLFVKNLLRWWLDADHWLQRYGDNRVLVLSWSGALERWPVNTAVDIWNREAFGDVPADRRPPYRGTPAPQPPGNLDLYLDGLPPTSPWVGESNLHNLRFISNNDWMNQVFRSYSMLILSASQIGIAELSGGGWAAAPGLAFQVVAWQTLPARDFGPPALPILAMRAAQQAVRENPHDSTGQLAVAQAAQALRANQEDHWLRGARMPRVEQGNLRDRLRTVQIVTSTYNALQLHPDSFDHHRSMAKLYIQQGMLDLAKERMEAAQTQLKVAVAAGAFPQLKDEKMKDAFLKQFDKEVDPLKQTVRLRLAQWKQNSAAMSPLQKAEYAQHGPYHQAGAEESPYGLGKKALEILAEIDEVSLEKKDVLKYRVLRYNLLLSQGSAASLVNELHQTGVREGGLPPALYANYYFLAAGAMGDYESMDQALPVLEKEIRTALKGKQEEVHFRRGMLAPYMLLMPTHPMPASLPGSVMLLLSPQHELNQTLSQVSQLHDRLYNITTLRGITALEAGDTKKAREILQTTLTEAGSEHFFTEHPIAQRYLDLLKEQVK